MACMTDVAMPDMEDVTVEVLASSKIVRGWVMLHPLFKDLYFGPASVSLIREIMMSQALPLSRSSRIWESLSKRLSR